jgi:hypothetical protein
MYKACRQLLRTWLPLKVTCGVGWTERRGGAGDPQARFEARLPRPPRGLPLSGIHTSGVSTDTSTRLERCSTFPSCSRRPGVTVVSPSVMQKPLNDSNIDRTLNRRGYRRRGHAASQPALSTGAAPSYKLQPTSNNRVVILVNGEAARSSSRV